MTETIDTIIDFARISAVAGIIVVTMASRADGVTLFIIAIVLSVIGLVMNVYGLARYRKETGGFKGVKSWSWMVFAIAPAVIALAILQMTGVLT